MAAQQVSASDALGGSTSRSRSRRFLNWRVILIELAVAAVSFYFFNVTTVRKPVIPGMIGVLIGIVAIWLAYRELAGLSINAYEIALPVQRLDWFPVFAFGRRKLLLTEVQRLTICPPWFGFQLVRISGEFGSEMLVFASRAQRRAFTRIFESLGPDIVIYRSRSIPE